ncbi:unnamed protein product, partial [Aphanomyces euteiches]
HSSTCSTNGASTFWIVGPTSDYTKCFPKRWLASNWTHHPCDHIRQARHGNNHRNQ